MYTKKLKIKLPASSSSQYDLNDYVFADKLADNNTPFVSHTIEIWRHKKSRKKVVVKKVRHGCEHSLVADLIGQRFFSLANLPVPKTSLVKFQGRYCLVEEFLYGYSNSPDPLVLPKHHENNRVVKSGIIWDIWLGHYDRQPYNFMFKGKDVIFIDFGGSLTSSPSGQIKGFYSTVSDQEILRCVRAFQGNQPVNAAYGKVISVIAGAYNPLILDKHLIKILIKKLAKITDEQIDTIVDEASMPFIKKNSRRIERILKTLSLKLKIPLEKLHYRHYHRNFFEAQETYQIIHDNFNNDESQYLKWALKERRNSIVHKFSNI
ncbi:MAG: hypothetical protein A2821_02215 [Candidatus Magasanikbacteria bacterium RIFCSPHIGHO2_01_FULL_41_23]|uniref:Uncharacterized protein n=1 Tax=Candidatus Magasanikbacteria bacterium RIFCSPLOWO2_01_FULL_40_15 TaxID=1798686 RepID=A0A1F6N2I1_9BACT|nr:MAG: hypothetical protein A2821_02215 [Candidatus Magasanikbacteria bacterium RIFCSPHIGHO2_01_FULL_41_23]OGH66832.1 MAG: hypothetical protein A3C66_02000 [Candidatus Magasanikbacteria bacterium RIFCSPHIGHO2_02_FULL_41_35]OGH74815.1 MAG: hypothetical protein A3F22_03925 [Candidatus Magasanikbacteria bacterium RIFCSPHIGHO2_12_FULL_41_16]OGH78091.1 MAG: hypothetical protein A2983_03350 [Candidatus Magasanikbacteria bacterium RIFCSPLOWO2_01_FULL_40_15]